MMRGGEMWERRGKSGDLLLGQEGDPEICSMNGCAGNAA